jgi:hypothetical protein
VNNQPTLDRGTFNVGEILVELAHDPYGGGVIARRSDGYAINDPVLGFDLIVKALDLEAHEATQEEVEEWKAQNEALKREIPNMSAQELIDRQRALWEDQQEHPMSAEEKKKFRELVREAIENLRLALGRCMIFGKMVLVNEGTLEDEEFAIVEEVWDSFPGEFFEITLSVTCEALTKNAESERRMTEGLDNLLAFMKAQQSTEDGSDITLEEAVYRHDEGTARLRKIIEGEEKES